MKLNRFFKPFGALLAAVGVLLSSGCFYSDAPLLAASEQLQPIRAGLWETLVAQSAEEWAGMSPEVKREKHCRAASGKFYCAQRVRMEAAPDKSYKLSWEGEKTAELVAVAPLAGDHFIVQQVASDGLAEYALATKSSPNAFTIRMPDCERDSYLRAYAPPGEGSSSRCRIADRQALDRLFMEFQARSPTADAKLYRRIGE